MSTPRFDVVIVGGGMIGASLACALACIGGETPLRLALVESFPLLSGQPGTYQPSFDARSTALSLSSRDFFSGLGVWDEVLAHAQLIRRIHVSDRGRFGSTRMDADEEQLPALGYVVENHWLGSVLHRQMRALTCLTLLAPASVATVRPAAGGTVLGVLQNEVRQELQTSLCVIADGARSALAAALGIGVTQQDYGQVALIANIAHREPHRGQAFERFAGSGPLAMLPLQSLPGESPRSALVWVLSPELAAEARTLPHAVFLSRLQSCFGYRLGRLLQCGERHAYPLSLLQATEQVRSGVAILGNAAHALHPVAGQGFNLSLRDVATLVAALRDACARGESPGALPVLEDFVRAQKADQQRTIGASDGLPRLFGSGALPLAVARDIGLIGLDLLPPLRSLLVRHATGLA